MEQHVLEGVWAKILRTLRTNKNFGLFGLLSTMNDVDFHDDQIVVHVHDETEKSMLKQHLPQLQELAEAGVTVTWQDDTVAVYDENRDYITRLKDLFGDKVEIV